MSDTSDSKFACDACGKQYAWKPQLAGKRGKCACGAAIAVPATDPAAREESDAPDDSDLYELAEGPVVSSAPRPVPIIPAAPARPVLSSSAGVGYGSAPTAADREKDRFAFDRLTHAPRDFYAPAALLAIGFVAMAAWAAREVDAGALGVMLVSLAVAVTTLVKTAVLTGLALLIAPRFGISFGDLRTAILKIAAIVVFTDAADLWLDVIMDATGAGNPQGRGARRGAFLASLLLAVALIGILSRYLFDMDADEVGMFAVPMALVSRVVGFVLKVITIGLLAGVAAGPAAPTPGATPPPAGTAAPPAAAIVDPLNGPADPLAGPGSAAPAAVPQRMSEQDQVISRRIGRNERMVEAREWDVRRMLKPREKNEWVDAFFDAAAKNVYYDLEGSTRGRPVRAIVVLPEGAAGRATCFAAARRYAADPRLTIDPSSLTDTGQRYLVIDIKPAAPR